MAASREAIGELAKQLRENEAFKAILAAMKANTLREWANTASGAADEREALFRDIQAIGRLEAAIQAAADNVTMDARKVATAARKASPRKGT